MDDRKRDMLRLRNKEFMSLREIAAIYGVSHQRVAQIIGNTGRGVLPKRRKRKVMESQDVTTSELADMLGVSAGTVYADRKGTCYKKNGQKGINQEYLFKVSEILSDVDHEVVCAASPYIHIYPATTVIVRVATKEFSAPTFNNTSPAYKFRVNMDMGFDFAVLVIADGDTEEYFVVPKNRIADCGYVLFCWPCDQSKSPYVNYHNRFDILRR